MLNRLLNAVHGCLILMSRKLETSKNLRIATVILRPIMLSPTSFKKP